MQTIVMVPLDGSRFAEQALPFALAVSHAAGADLELVRVEPVLPLGLSRDDARSYLERTAAQLQPVAAGAVRGHVVLEDFDSLDHAPAGSDAIADALRHRSLEGDVLLIVMATHGYGGVKRAWLGSVADAIIRMAPRPVLLVRPEAEDFTLAAAADRGFHNIVIPLDGSESAAQVVPLAQSFGAPFGARYMLVRVTSPLTWDVPYAPYVMPEHAYGPALSEEGARAYLETIAAPLRQRGAEVSTHVLLGGSPASLIVDFAKEHGADLIAIGTEGAGRVRRLLLGSVTDKIVRSSELPVLVCNVRSMAAHALAMSATEAAHV